MQRVNRWVSAHIVEISQSPNVEGEKVGALKAAFPHISKLHQASRRMKQWTRNAYYAVAYAVIALVVGGMVWSAVG